MAKLTSLDFLRQTSLINGCEALTCLCHVNKSFTRYKGDTTPRLGKSQSLPLEGTIESSNNTRWSSLLSRMEGR